MAAGSRAAGALSHVAGSSLRPTFERMARSYSSIPASKEKYVPSSGTYPKGFKVSGVHAGVKPSNTTKPDLALLVSEQEQNRPCEGAAVFSVARYLAAPVLFTQNVLKQRSEERGVRAVVINSGCANAITGQGGLDDAAKMAQITNQVISDKGNDPLGGETMVMSTGVIGQR
jgi:glutamate N-acetyltransferase / amino-acid N-acetyltransferase